MLSSSSSMATQLVTTVVSQLVASVRQVVASLHPCYSINSLHIPSPMPTRCIPLLALGSSSAPPHPHIAARYILHSELRAVPFGFSHEIFTPGSSSRASPEQ